MGVADQRLCFYCKKTGHIARYCTAVDTTMKQAGAGVVLKATVVKTAAVKKPTKGFKALCIPDAICDVIVGNVDGARGPEDPGMSMMVGAATTRAQAKRDAVTKPLRVPDMERHGGVDREQLIKLQQEDPRVQELVDAGKLLGEERKLFPSRRRGASCIVDTKILDIM
ncbi:hypothetical protein ElyMa_000049600 [Elysia marginata]|uniref:CCHC-type domain-containing protein n=1 Tax=Elysia marginata TaxID=1093978 RepID=A0AAV4EEN4_9GAST|nr:hypothetical protein ElyMa_000049600 [Elysia marginata]